MAGIVKLSDITFDEPNGVVPLNSIKFDDQDDRSAVNIVDDFLKPTAKAVPRVATHTMASMAQMPVSGLSALAKLITSKGDLSAANKVLEDNQQALNDFYLKTPEEQKGAENIALAMKPIQMAGEGLKEIVKQTPLEGTIAEPIAGTIGEASAMFGLGGTGKALKARTRMGGLRDVLEPIKNETAIKPQEVVKLDDVKLDKTPKTEQPAPVLYSGLDPTIAADIMKSVSAKTAEIYNANKTPTFVKEGIQAAKDTMIERDRNIRRAESTAKLFEKTVNDIVPNTDRQMLMVHAFEHKLKGKYWDQLTEIEKGVVRWIGQEKEKQLNYIKENDILEIMTESEDINHIYHSWINKETGEPYPAMYGKFSKGLPQAKQRTIPTYEAGILQGEKPATTNIGKLVGLELESITRAGSARQLFQDLHGVKGDETLAIVRSPKGQPQPIRMVEGWSDLEKQGLTDGYVRYDSPFLDKSITHTSKDGRLVTMKGAVGVKEELYPFVKAYIENPQYGKLSELNFAAKSLTLGASLFHVVSLGMQELANLRMPFVNIPKGLKITKDMGVSTRLLHQEGLELFKGYEDLGYQNKFFDSGTTLGKAGNVFTYPLAKMRDFIFGYVQPGMKVSFADALINKLMPKYLDKTGWTAEEALSAWDKGKPMPPEVKAKMQQCAREVVEKVDGHFSGEHYKRSLLESNRFMAKMYFSPEARVKWQAALLSPTWQREHLLVAKNVAKSFMPDSMIKKLGLREMGPIKSQYRQYALGAAMMVGAVDLWNYQSSLMMDGQGKHLWENPKGKGFAVRAWWDEPAYQVTDKNGRVKTVPSAPAYIRPLKSVFEVAEWVHDPFKKMGYKLSPALSAMGEQLFGMKQYDGLPAIPERAWDYITDSATPIVVDQSIRTAQGKQSLEAAVFPFFGMPVSRVKPEKRRYE